MVEKGFCVSVSVCVLFSLFVFLSIYLSIRLVFLEAPQAMPRQMPVLQLMLRERERERDGGVERETWRGREGEREKENVT